MNSHKYNTQIMKVYQTSFTQKFKATFLHDKKKEKKLLVKYCNLLMYFFFKYYLKTKKISTIKFIPFVLIFLIKRLEDAL